MTTSQKGAARRAAFARRKAAHAQGLDGSAQEALSAFLAEHAGKPLAGYIPIRTEINPLPVMAAWTGPVGVPVIQGADEPLEFHLWTPGCAMKDGPFGAKVPEDARAMTPEVVIVPLVAFDEKGFRLGYGGGFYDRTLERLRARGPVTAIGLAYAAQDAEELPLEPTDQPLDAIATDRGLRLFG
ncbi:MAG: 5-formyltetrahydrofolate cyclo-ligase [Pseudomonadota bacterium]